MDYTYYQFNVVLQVCKYYALRNKGYDVIAMWYYFPAETWDT